MACKLKLEKFKRRWQIICACGLEDQIPINWSSSAHVIEIYHFSQDFLQNDFASQLLPQSMSLDVASFYFFRIYASLEGTTKGKRQIL